MEGGADVHTTAAAVVACVTPVDAGYGRVWQSMAVTGRGWECGWAAAMSVLVAMEATVNVCSNGCDSGSSEGVADTTVGTPANE